MLKCQGDLHHQDSASLELFEVLYHGCLHLAEEYCDSVHLGTSFDASTM